MPAGYDTYVPETDSKRSIIERKECGNCSEEFHADYEEFVPPPEMNHFPLSWCSPECFLSYAKNSLYQRQYTALEAAIWTWEEREVIARPSRFLLEKNGGTIPISDYLANTQRPMIEGGTKRVKMRQTGEEEDGDYMEF